MTVSELKLGSKIYLLGICGTAMASLAGLLKSMGYHVTGVDQNSYPPMSNQLEALGIEYHRGYSEDNLKKTKPDFVIVGNVISKSNPEVRSMEEMKIPYTSLPSAMGELFLKRSQSLVVAGTHGKTTTTSALAWVLDHLGLEVGFLIGGIPKNFNSSFRLSKGNIFVVEGDEYDTAFFDKVPKFTHYFPQHAILTSVEFDHADIYNSLDEVKDAFSRLLKCIRPGGFLIYHGDDYRIQSILSAYPSLNKISYGLSESNDVVVKVVSQKHETNFFQFELYFKVINKSFLFESQLFGAHNALNLAAVITLVNQVLMQPLEGIARALPLFSGVKRRQEILGQPRGITIIEDFAHHPTAVAETLRALTLRYPGKKIRAIFEPRSATSRRKVFQEEYIQSFKEADFICIKEAFDQSKIHEADRFSSQDLVVDLIKSGKSAQYFQDTDRIVETIVAVSQPGDVIVVMSNGGFDGIYQMLLSRLAAPQLPGSLILDS